MSAKLKTLEDEIYNHIGKLEETTSLYKIKRESSNDLNIASSNLETCSTNACENNNNKDKENIEIIVIATPRRRESEITVKSNKYNVKYEKLEHCKLYHYIILLDCKAVANREHKIYEINKILAERYDEEINHKKNLHKLKQLKELDLNKIKSSKNSNLNNNNTN
jgi:hypothetical protein